MNELYSFVQNKTSVLNDPVIPPYCDLVFFKVAQTNIVSTDAETLRQLVQNNKQGEFGDLDLFDGNEHSYIEIGGWFGDQGMALRLMGLGVLLGLWDIMTPRMLPIPEEMVQQMAGLGMVSVIPKANKQ